MARRRRAFLPSRPWLAVRGLLALGTATAIGVALVARATGDLEPTADVYVGVPVSAGLITTQAPVRYHGVNVGRIAEIESGTQTSLVRLAVDSADLGLIPASVVARIVPRTFFGDVYLQLVDAVAGQDRTPLTDGAVIHIDDSADAVALYDVFSKIVDVFAQLKPERMQAALTALSQALHNRGGELGATIDNLSAITGTLSPALTRFLDTTPQFRDVMDALHRATPDVIDTLSAATEVSNRMVDDQAGIVGALDAVTGVAAVLTPLVSEHREHLITIVDAAGRILASTTARPDGIVDTLAGARAFGEAGARVFATGKFDITAVATFSGPMPYDIADCPVYGATYGAHCGDAAATHTIPTPPVPYGAPDPNNAAPQSDNAAAPPPAPPLPAEAPLVPGQAAPASAIVGGEPEAHALALLETELTGTPTQRPNIATVLVLGPVVRGTEVRIP